MSLKVAPWLTLEPTAMSLMTSQTSDARSYRLFELVLLCLAIASQPSRVVYNPKTSPSFWLCNPLQIARTVNPSFSGSLPDKLSFQPHDHSITTVKMKASFILSALPFILPLTLATPFNPLLARAESCTAPEGSGTCKATSSCTGFHVAGYCSGGTDNQCCIAKTCSTSSGSGTCKNTDSKCSGGTFVAGACPGDSTVKCCVLDSKSSGGGSSDSDTGSKVVAAAEPMKGLPYVWGGGDTKGPTGGGFDCSGLTLYSVYKATGLTIPRHSANQYTTSTGHHVPRAQAKKGDLLFWAPGGKCDEHIDHVGIYISANLMIVAPHTGKDVMEQNIWTENDGTKICPDAVRFW